MTTSLQAFLFTDIVGSTALKRELGDAEGARIIAAHDVCFREAVARFGGVEQNNPGDGFFATFPVPSAALNCALAFQAGLADMPLEARVGIHMGESVRVPGAENSEKLLGLAVDTAGRVMSLAKPNQILITRHAFDSARQNVLRGPAGERVVWRAHGPYDFKGLDEPIEIHEAGIKGVAPLTPPEDSEKARRAIAPGDEETLGWRPGAGLNIPGRAGWRLERKLGEGGFGEAWLAVSENTKEGRAFKFCFRADRLRSLKRELTLFRLLRETLGERSDIARLYDVRLDKAPFFLEMEHTPDGSLDQYEGFGAMPLEDRVLFAAEVAEALGAAHSVGVLHKDIKPSNILVRTDTDGGAHARLTDFGIGQLIDPGQLEAAQVSGVGFSETGPLTDLGSRTGTRLYMAPELFVGKPASIASDVHAFGVLLFQLVVGDLNKPLAQGWERDVADPLLAEDIAACVAGNPKERPASCDLVAARLRSLDARRRERAAGERRARLRRFTSVAAIVLLLAAVAGFVVAGMLEKRRRDTERALAEVLRLADSKKVTDLLAEKEELWPVHPDRAPAMADWNKRAHALLANRADHEKARAQLDAHAERSAEDDWRHQVLTDLLRGMNELAASQAAIAAREEAARTLRARSIDAHRTSWDETIRAIAGSPRYGGMRLTPQLGLVPLGPDPQSGLFEFAHMDSGAIPARDPNTKRLVLTDDFALVLVLIPGGTFRMGQQNADPTAPNYVSEGPGWTVHEVTLSAYFLSKYECTQAQWEELTGERPSRYAPGSKYDKVTLRHPVEQVSWNDCTLRLARRNLVLPTEAQWEYGCRAGTQTPWFTGLEAKTLSGAANIADAFLKANGGLASWVYTEDVNDGYVIHAPVGSLEPNRFGLHDVHGNVLEWCRDTQQDLPAEPVADPLVQGDGWRVYRGGSWHSVAPLARSGDRRAADARLHVGDLGVRPSRRVD